MRRYSKWVATALVTAIGGLAAADTIDPANVARLNVDRDALKARLATISPGDLATEAVARTTLEQIARIDDRLAGTAEDPLLGNEAIRAYRRHQLLLTVLAERAQRAKSAQAELRAMLAKDAANAAAADAKVRDADTAMADASSRPEDAVASYVRAIEGYAAAIRDLKAIAPKQVLEKITPPPSVNSLEGVIVADGVLCPTDEQLRTRAAALNGKPVRVKLKIAAMSRPYTENGTTDFVTTDEKVRATMQWNQSPADVKKAFGQRSTTKAAMNVGDLVWVTGIFRGLEAPEQCSIVVQAARK